MTTYAIEMYFDRDTEAKLMALARKIGELGISTKFLQWKTRPHVTLAIFNDVDEERCVALLQDFVKDKPPMPAFLDSVGMFNDTRTVFLNPTMTRQMYRMQAALHDALAEFDTTGWAWYRPDGWVPHCTVALTGEDPEEAFYRASELVLRNFSKIAGTYASLGLVKITFPVEEIAEIPFSLKK